MRNISVFVSTNFGVLTKFAVIRTTGSGIMARKVGPSSIHLLWGRLGRLGIFFRSEIDRVFADPKNWVALNRVSG